MSALEAVIQQRLREFDQKKPDTSQLKQDLESLKNEKEKRMLDGGDANQSKVDVEVLDSRIRAIKQEIAELEKPSEDELNYVLQVGYLLYQNGNEEEDLSNNKDNEKTFYGCSVKVEKQKGLAYKRYMADIENDSTYKGIIMRDSYMSNKTKDEKCTHCAGKLVSSRECTYCKDCGIVNEDLMLDNGDLKNNITYEQQINDVVIVYSYNRLNHLNEWLSKLQAREMTDIPSEVMDALRLELKKARISDPKLINQKKVKELLKKLKFSKYYEHVPSITNTLTGAEVLKFPQQLEDKFRSMFEQIQVPFHMYCPKNRKNFLHYGYVIYKFCELLGEDRWLPYIPMLKSFEKIYVQDQIWKQICTHLKWEFIPSV